MRRPGLRLGTWVPDPDFVLGPLAVPRPHRLRLEHFPAGIDNVHTDVFLTPDLSAAALNLARTALSEDIHRYFWREPVKTPDLTAAESFRLMHAAVTQAVLGEGAPDTRLDRTQLYQLAVLKCLLEGIDRELGRLREDLERARDRAGLPVDGRALSVHERLVVLAKGETSIRYRSARHVLRILRRLEVGTLRKRREAVLGVAWPVAQESLFNPLLQFRDLSGDAPFAAEYAWWLCDPSAFARMNALAVELLAPWLPEFVRHPIAGPPPAPPDVRGIGAVERWLKPVVTPDEYRAPRLGWLDQPHNLVALLGGEDADRRSAGPWRHPRWPGFQHDLRTRLYAACRRDGLLPEVLASYEAVRLHQALAVPGLAHLLYEGLAGRLSRREFARRLDGLTGVRDAHDVMRALDAGIRRLRHATRAEQTRVLVHALGDYARLRRDLKWAWQMFSRMDQLRLLEDPEEVTLSRTNGLLQEFHGPGASAPEARPVVGHVVLKADVRGSTPLAARMRAADLNVAAYFSRNLYNPINTLRRIYGAEKVFVEGDAVILAILERRGDAGQAVAWACGLARKILQVMDAKNRRNRRRGLPELELGLGIAYVDDAPAYLFDEGHRITISPAINRADRLSGCHAGLRRQAVCAETGGRGVAVFQAPPAGDDGATGLAPEELLRYNVNGIELDAPAFYRLRKELQLQRVTLDDTASDHYYLARYPDTRGDLHWLAVREAPIRRWSGGECAVAVATPRRFYEVVTDRSLLERLCRRLQGGASTVRPAESSGQKTGNANRGN